MTMSPVMMTHIAAGSVGILSGFVAIFAAKGAGLHRIAGGVFVASMLVTAAAAVWISFAMDTGTAPIGILAFYMVFTSWLTVWRKESSAGSFEVLALSIALGCAAIEFVYGYWASSRPHGFHSFPPAFYYAFAGLALFAAALDLKVIVRRGIAGAPRIARHLWRMCFGFFTASGSFFIGQQKNMPQFMHGSPVLLVLGVAPLLLLVFWMIRVRLTNWYATSAAVHP